MLGIALLTGLAVIPALPPAQRFVRNYQALQYSAEPLSTWERLTFSYLLARNSGERPKERADSWVRPFRP